MTSSAMKIGLVSPYDFSFPGGVAEHISHLDEQFQRLGHEVTIITPASSQREAVARANLFRVGKGVPVPANGTIARITLSLRLSGQVKRLLQRERFDVIHIHEPMLPALPLMVLRHSQSINVGTFHAYWKSNAGYLYARPIIGRFFRKLHGRIAVSRAARDFVAEHLPGEYAIIPNGIDLRRFNDSVPPLAELRDGKRNILFVGRMERRKGFRYLLKAYRTLKRQHDGIRLIVVGGYCEAVRARAENHVREEGLSDVVFTGYVPAHLLPRYYASADVFCAPSTGSESFGIVLLEAMASGKPIVASNIDGYRDVIQDGVQGLLVPPGDDGGLAFALGHLLADPDRGREFGQAGLLKASEYSWPKIARRVLEQYDQASRRVKAPVETSGVSTTSQALASARGIGQVF